MPYTTVNSEYTKVDLKRFQHEYICECCEDEFTNPIDKSFIRSKHLCSYCLQAKLLNKPCDCNQIIKLA